MTLLQRLTSRLTIKIGFLVALEILIIAGSFAIVSSFETRDELLGNSINITGKTRFLTSTVLLDSEYYLSDHSRLSDFQTSLSNLEANILLVRQGGQIGEIEVGALPPQFIAQWQTMDDNFLIVKAQAERLMATSNAEEQLVVASELNASGSSLVAASDTLVTELGQSLEKSTDDLVMLQISLAILNIAVHVLMLYLIIRSLRPIKLLTKATTSVSEGNLNISLIQKGSDELQILTGSFNSMVEGLRQSSHMLAMEKQKYYDLYDGAPDLYQITNRKGIVLDCNESYVKNLGYSNKNELIGKSIFDVTAEQSLDAMRNAFETWRRKCVLENVEIWLRRKDGSTFPTLISATAAIVYHDNKEIVASNMSIIDTTKMLKAKRELEEANKQLSEANRMKTDFIRIASHELRTPIQPILAYSELGKKGIVNPKEALDAINQQALRLKRLANDIVDVTSIGGGYLALEMEDCSINEIVREAIEKERNLVHHGVVIKPNLHPADEETIVSADKKRMAQVIGNLINNAMKFTNVGEINVSTAEVYDSRYVEFVITDTGKGIPPEILPTLFSIFSAASVNAGADHGTGFGLFIAKSIVRLHGGSIIGFNNIKGGATFKLWLPIKRLVDSDKKETLVTASGR